MQKVIAAVLALICLLVAPLPMAEAADSGHLDAMHQRFQKVHMDFGVDSVTADQSLTGEYIWHFHIGNQSGGTVYSPTISVTSDLSPDYFPAVVSWPYTASLDSLGHGERWIMKDLGGRSTLPATFTPGYDLSRKMEPLEIPPGGGEQKITVRVKSVDERYSPDAFMRVEIRGNVIPGSNTQPEGARVTSEEGEAIVWEFHGAEFGVEYTFTVRLWVDNPEDVNLLYKPWVQVYMETTQVVSEVTSATSITISDPSEPIVTTTYSVTGEYLWRGVFADAWMVTLHGLIQPATNFVRTSFGTFWGYRQRGDTFTNHEVTGDISWFAFLRNYPPDATGQPVINAALTLETDRTFSWFGKEPPDIMGPPEYVWQFGDIPEEPFLRAGAVGLEVGAVSFYPGVDASREVNPKELCGAGTPSTQTVTIRVIPREAMNLLVVWVTAPEDDKVSPVIISATADTYEAEEMNLFPGGHRLQIVETSPELGKEYVYTVTIEVTPKVEKVIFKPSVKVYNGAARVLASGTVTGSSVSRATEVGKWTWSADGTYTWNWREAISKLIAFPRYSNIPPIAEAGGPYMVEVGLPLTLDGSASTDPDGEIRAYNWDFGDGTTGTGALVEHTYNATGLYTATLTVIDNRGARGLDTALVVVYDPEAGFATGGGWFIPGGKTSDEGDFLPNIDNTSPAEFGFVVKYKPGATTPDGQLEFQYRQGDFNLHSSGMDWLVIVNNNWAKFQGAATIKGMDGLFPFRVDARDGDFGGGTEPDRFIIKVWASGDDPDSADPIYKASGNLEGGSIVIHAKNK